MPNPPLPSPEEPTEPDDAALLWQDESDAKPVDEAPMEPRGAPGESYDLTELASGGEGAAPARRPVPLPLDDSPGRRGSLDAGGGEPEDVVDVIYTRWAEWRATILRLVGVALATLFVAYFSLDLGWFGVTGAVLLIGMAAGLVLSYPMLVTLERPVRFTPEQTLRDYYGSLEHYIPQVRRMWLLLSRDGRQSSRFASFEGYQRYWETRLASLRGANLSAWTPLVFEIVDYEGEKSGDLDALSARFRVRVSARGHRAEGPIATIPVKARLMRGPDRQWYLRDGMLPEVEADRGGTAAGTSPG